MVVEAGRSERRKATKRATVSKSIPPIISIFPAIETRRAAQNSRLAAFLPSLSLTPRLSFSLASSLSFSVAPREERTATAATGSRGTRGIAGSDDNIKLVVLAVAALRRRRAAGIADARIHARSKRGDPASTATAATTAATTTRRRNDQHEYERECGYTPEDEIGEDRRIQRRVEERD